MSSVVTRPETSLSFPMQRSTVWATGSAYTTDPSLVAHIYPQVTYLQGSIMEDRTLARLRLEAYVSRCF